MIHGFYWLIRDGLAGCSRPGGRTVPSSQNGFDQGGLHRDLAWLGSLGVSALLSLTETPLPGDALARYGFEGLHMPVADMTAPTARQFEQALAFIDWQRAMGRAVLVHCKEGQGRTGTILAAYLIRGGTRSAEAIAELRSICPGAIGTKDQEAALESFEGRRDWIV